MSRPTPLRLVNGQMIWPYSIQQLRIDEPQVSIWADPSDEFLSQFGVIYPMPTLQPEPDPEVERVVEVAPVEQDGEWLQQWEVEPLTEEEAEAYYRATHPPQWIAFYEALPNDVNVLLSSAQAIDQRLYLGLGVGLGVATLGDQRGFLRAWGTALAAGLIPPEMVAGLQALAVAHDLPAEFVAGLGGES